MSKEWEKFFITEHCAPLETSSSAGEKKASEGLPINDLSPQLSFHSRLARWPNRHECQLKYL